MFWIFLMIKFFCSYSYLLRCLKEETFDDCVLDKALYSFGAMREHIFRPVDEDHEVAFFSKDESVQNYLADKSKEIVMKAESEGRIIFRRSIFESIYESGPDTVSRASTLLERNGFKPLGSFRGTCNYRMLKELVEEKNPTVEVLWK